MIGERASEMTLGDISSTSVLAPCHTLPVASHTARLTISNKSQSPLPGDKRQGSLDIDHSLNTNDALISNF